MGSLLIHSLQKRSHMRANFETERRFLVDSLPKEILESPSLEQVEGYVNDDGARVRVTLKTHFQDLANLSPEQIATGFVGMNVPTNNPEILLDEDHEVSPQLALSLLNSCVGNIIRKTQYVFEHGGHQWTVNIYGGHLKGLKIAEVHHPVSQMQTLQLPSFVRREITSQSLLSERILSRIDRLDTIWSMIYGYNRYQRGTLV